jgi:hypothetical protein
MNCLWDYFGAGGNRNVFNGKGAWGMSDKLQSFKERLVSLMNEGETYVQLA